MITAVIAGLTSISVANAEISVIVNPSNPVNSLSERQVRKLFLGKTTLFPFTEQEALIIDQNPSQGVYHSFYRNLLHINPQKLARYRAASLFSGNGPVPLVLADDVAVIEFVLNHPEAIGYVLDLNNESSVKTVYSFAQD
ncbi:periplasmic solute-binding protein [Oleiphilus messinensis]|uniref:Periplasmic solute-binding protein n=2 Tax=Oleiphilus messinensis TaxID=141451 RepID=A0A1Y0I5C8_9GAMM|nr:periplasmic solute-binding protein [Oleiphilus messinensis]